MKLDGKAVHKRADWGEVPDGLPRDSWLFAALCSFARRYTTCDNSKVTCKRCLKLLSKCNE